MGSIAKKGNNYYAYLRINCKKKWFSGAGPSKRKAEAILTEKLADVQQGTYREIPKILFRDIAATWLASYAAHKVKDSTLRSYRDIVSNHLVPAFGDCLLGSITTAMLQQYVSDKLDTEKPAVASLKKATKTKARSPETKPPATFRPKTVINEVVVMKEMFKHATRWGYVKVNPAQYVERPRVERKEMEALSPDEVRRLLEYSPPRFGTLFLMAVLTGMRRGELVALRIEQGQNVKYIMHQLGHASIQTTLDRYGHLMTDVNAEQAKKLDGILGFDRAETHQLKVVEKW